MKPWTVTGTTALITLLALNPVLADVTPEDVWLNWQNLSRAGGGTLTTGSVVREGDTLVIKDLKTSADNDSGKSESLIAEARLRDKGDGTVEVTLSEQASFVSTMPAKDGEPASGASGVVKMPGLVGTVSGTPEAATYAYIMPSLEMQIEPTKDGKAAGKVKVLLSDSTGGYLLSGPADAKTLDGTFAAASAAINIEVSDEEGSVTGSLNAADLAGKMLGNFAGIEMPEAADALAAGFGIDTSLSYGALNYDLDLTGDSGPAKLVGGSEGGSFQMAMDAARLLIAGGGKNAAVTFSGADLPFPEVKISYAESGFNLTMPLAKSDAPQDFSLLTKLVDLQVSEEIWGMIDPTSVLPHDPATLVIDTKGKGLLKSDLMAKGDVEPDGELLALDITQLNAKVAGAELTGSGAFTFDNTDLETYDGMPVPTGKLDLKLLGGNGLLDKLVAMGLVGEDEAMGARMMIAMFANPGAGEDELTSTLEFKDKHFYANGQQLQ